jgi:histidinol-phosphate/aromatic aminotransferase/cobyric acid decarboxylase-like protein
LEQIFVSQTSSISPEPHGGPDYGELSSLGLRPEDVLDFSASTNAFGPPPGVLAALAACDVTRYPDRGASPLAGALAARDGVPADRVLAGNGAAGLIWALALAWLRPGDAAFVVGPTFGEYAVASRLARAEVLVLSAVEGGEWRYVPARPGFAKRARGTSQVPGTWKLAGAITAARPRLIWLCNPNNPTGAYLSAAEIAALLPAAPDALWVLDEAYRPFVADPWPSVPLIERGNVALLRSLTKDCALPGVRLGYLLAGPDVVARVAAAQPPWSVSAAAIACGLAALDDGGHVARTTAALRGEAIRLAGRLAGQGWRVLPSATHFMLIEVGDAAAVRAALLREHRIQVRNCASFGLPGFIRVAARLPEENDRLIEAMSRIHVPGTSQVPGT